MMKFLLIRVFLTGIVSISCVFEGAASLLTHCPRHFYKFPIPDNAKQCQRFDNSFPATLIFHATVLHHTLIKYYQEAYPSIDIITTVQGRTLMSAENHNIRVLISPDGKGTQVDIMLLSPQHAVAETQ